MINTNQRIARVFLTSRFRQLVVAVLSVTFGIAMYVFMNSFMTGVNSEQTEITFTSMSHIRIFNDLSTDVPPLMPFPQNEHTVLMVNNARNIRHTEGIRNAAALKRELEQLSDITGVTTQFNQNVFIRNGVSRSSATLSGIETEGENKLFRTSEFITEGDLYELERRSNGIILGTGLALKIGVGMGDNVLVATSDGVTKSFKVIGLIETGANIADKTKALVSIKTARQLFSENSSYASEILVNIKDYNEAPAVAAKLSHMTNYEVEAWQDGNSQLDSASVLRDIIAIAVSLAILLVAGFGIYNIMNMTVNEKIKEIAILKAMGFNGKDVVEIFLTQSVIIGLIGGWTGLFLGNLIVRFVDRVPFEMGPLETLPVAYRPQDYLLAFGFGLLITFLAGYFPARNASKIDPVEILRG